MKLKNKKTGEIIEAESCNNTGGCISIYYEEKDGQIGTKDCYTSLAELNANWEDAPEEPKKYWYISDGGDVYGFSDYYVGSEIEEAHREIDNLFETKEEAEKAVEKLKARKRLKEANIDYKLTYEYDDFTETMHANVSFSFNSYPLVGKDLDLLFSGEDD